MMHSITSTQAQHLAQLVAALRPGWDIPGIRAAIHAAKDRAPADDLALALIRLTRRTDLRTPAVLAEDGPHWLAPDLQQVRDSRRPKCPEHQVDTRVSDGLCPLCLADRKGGDGYEGQGWERDDPDRIEMNRMGAEAVRRAINHARTSRTKEQDQ